MVLLRRRATWLIAALVVLASGTVGAALATADAAAPGTGRDTVHHTAVDHDAVAVSSRPIIDRSATDLRPDHTTLLLLAWVSVLMGAALLARTTLRSVELGARRARSVAPLRRAFDRGPPALACV